MLISIDFLFICQHSNIRNNIYINFYYRFQAQAPCIFLYFCRSFSISCCYLYRYTFSLTTFIICDFTKMQFIYVLLYISTQSIYRSIYLSVSHRSLFPFLLMSCVNRFCNCTKTIYDCYIQVLNARRPSFFVTIDNFALILHSTAMASTTAKTFPMNRTVLVNKQQTYL